MDGIKPLAKIKKNCIRIYCKDIEIEFGMKKMCHANNKMRKKDK